MGFRLNVSGGGTTVSLDERYITKVLFDSNSPEDSNARATDFGIGLKVEGKLIFDIISGGDDTLELAKWSQVPSDRADCYRNVEIEVIAAGQVIRKITLPNAFVVGYTEHMNDDEGVGLFYLSMKQKKDLNTKVAVEGGYTQE